MNYLENIIFIICGLILVISAGLYGHHLDSDYNRASQRLISYSQQ